MSSDALKLLTVSYPSGNRIVLAGERGNCMFVVHEGQVRLLRTNGGEGAARTDVGLLEKGDFFGEGALLEGRPYSTDAEAVSDCEIVEIGPSTFQRMLQSHPEIAVRMLRKLAGRVERIEGRLSEAGAAQEGESPLAAPVEHQTDASPQPEAVSATNCRLVVEGGGETFTLSGTEVLVGRYDPVTEVQPEIDLSEVDSNRSVSRRHARLRFEDGSWHASEEVGTLNGTFVNGERIQAGRSVALREGDVVTLGMVRMVYRDS
jgi:CRP-like cAMP-binding protein